MGDDTVTTIYFFISKLFNDIKVTSIVISALKILGFRKGRAGSIPASSTKSLQKHVTENVFIPLNNKGLRLSFVQSISSFISKKRTETLLLKCSAKEAFGVVGDDTMTPLRSFKHATNYSTSTHIFNPHQELT